MKLLIINGPNLNLIGSREPEIYGTESPEAMVARLKNKYPGIHLNYCQSNIEGELINFIQAAGSEYDGIILNAGGYTHTSVALGDAVRAASIPVVEVHMSNVMDRENYRHISLISASAEGVISGFGSMSYELAIIYFINK
ncbi:MAG: type II 3-dehydroquinate dehydratase [Bacteroidia bacterium]